MMNSIFDFSQYTWWIALVQVLTAYVIFRITNIIGGHTPEDKGYMSLSLITEKETMPAFNMAFKVLTPLVQFILIVAVAQKTDNLKCLLSNCYMIMTYYWLIRTMYYCLFGYRKLTNWGVVIGYFTTTLFLAVIVYYYMDKVGSILPSIEALRDQLWILIALFVYELINKLQINRKATKNRKSTYILAKYKEFQYRYNIIVRNKCRKPIEEVIVYAIMIVENFNRPPIIRFVEYVSFYVTHKEMSLGVMQVKTTKFIDNNESVIRGCEIIQHLIEEELNKGKEHTSLNTLVHSVAEKYSGGDADYAYEVEDIVDIILVKKYNISMWEIESLNTFYIQCNDKNTNI